MKNLNSLIVVAVLLLVVIVGATSANATTTNTTTIQNVTVNENENKQKQEQSQDNNQTVNVTTNQVADLKGSTIRANEPRPSTKKEEVKVVETESKGGTVSATVSSVPGKQPQTGVSILALSSLLGTGAAGYALSRFGQGKKGETLEEFANSLIGKKQEN